MASRTVLARLVLDGVEGVITGFKKAGSAAVEYGNVAMKAGDKATAWTTKHRSQLDSVGGSLVKMGAVGVVALGGLVKSAVDWESAWAGVTKTVNGTPEQLAAIEQGLRDMTKVLPASHEELAAVAEAAGQLGIETDSVLGFTKTMVDLGETTNLSSEEAATSLAQLMNVMGTAQSDVGRLGAAVVALGNDGASTEADIVAMAQRIAAAGNQAGMSEADVLGFASALSSVGVEAEAGGTAVSLTFKQMGDAARNGGDELDLIAEASGMSAAEFRRAWQEDAGTAVATFVEGLGAMQSSGEDVNGLLEELGMTGIRQTDSLLRLAGATKAAGTEQDLLRESLELGTDAWIENMALVEEAEQRYATPAAKAQMALNALKDEAITLGQTLLPVFADLVSGVSDFAEMIGGLPEPVKDVGLKILAVGSAGAIAVGGVMKIAAGLASMRVTAQALGLTLRTMTLTMGAAGVALTAAGFILAAFSGQQADAKDRVDAYTAAMREQNSVTGESTRIAAAKQLIDNGAMDKAKELGVALNDVTDAVLGNDAAYKRVTTAIDDEIAALDKEIEAKVASGGYTSDLSEEQRRLLQLQQELTGAVDTNRESFAEAAGNYTDLQAATEGIADSSETAADAAQAHAEAEQKRAEQVAAAEQALIDARDAAQAYGDMLLQLSGSQIGVESAIDGVTASLKENGKTLDLDSEKGRNNQKALDDLARASMSYITTLDEQGASTEEIAAATERARGEWVKGAVAMGMTQAQAEELAAAYFAIPEDVKTTVVLPGAKTSKQEADDLNDALEGLPDDIKSKVSVEADRAGYNAALAMLQELARTRTAFIRVVTTGATRAPTVGRTLMEADGGVVDYYANGGLREKHVAQIAAAGSLRVWAEPETGGESYIPLAPSKRARSLQIWQETGRRLGVQGFANGAVVGGSSSSVVGDTFIVQPGAFTGAFSGVRTAADMEAIADDLPRLIAQKGRRNG